MMLRHFQSRKKCNEKGYSKFFVNDELGEITKMIIYLKGNK